MLRASLCLAATLILSAPVCSQEFRYKPADSILSTLTEQQSLDLLRELFGAKPMGRELAMELGEAARWKVFYLERAGRTVSNSSLVIRRVEVFDDRIRLTADDRRSEEFPYRDMRTVEAFDKPAGLFDHGATGVTLGEDKALLVFAGRSEIEQSGLAFIRRLADALYVLKRSAEGASPEQDRRFGEVAAQYRAATSKPAFPEEARRFRVQAEAAVRERRMADAARLYGQALKIAPWWPEGRFNRSLVLAETNRHGEAIAEMKRYLLLVPEAPNARAAQDKIYEWEAKLPGLR